MDSRGTERLSPAAHSDAERRYTSSIVVTMSAGLVLGLSAGTILVVLGLDLAVGVLAFGAILTLALGYVVVEMVQVSILGDARRWLPVVAADQCLALSMTALLMFKGWAPLVVGIVCAFTVQSIARAIVRSAALVVSWELEFDDSRIRYRRLVFSRPRGPWYSTGLEDARPRVLRSGRDWFLELDGAVLPVGSADEQVRELADRISRAASARGKGAEPLRDDDRVAVLSLVPSSSSSTVRTNTPVRLEATALALALPVAVGFALFAPWPVAAAFVGVIGLRSGLWSWARRLTDEEPQRTGASRGGVDDLH